MGSQLAKLLFFLGMLAVQLTLSPLCSADLFDAYANKQYDADFQYSTQRFLSEEYGNDWYLLKAQGIQESLLNPYAVSPVGARGIMQFMPATWAEVSQQLGIEASPYNARASIVAGGFYQRRMLRVWTAERSSEDRRRWAWSSYNYGVGNVLKAQKRAEGATDWWYIRPYLPQETIMYVYKIEKHWRIIK